MAGVSVSFNNIPAPLLFVSQGQINAQLPWNVLPDPSAPGTVGVVVQRGSGSSQARQISVGPFSPGIFSVQFGTGQAIAINLNGTIAAPVGSIRWSPHRSPSAPSSLRHMYRRCRRAGRQWQEQLDGLAPTPPLRKCSSEAGMRRWRSPEWPDSSA
jgi:hypothetical protein